MANSVAVVVQCFSGVLEAELQVELVLLVKDRVLVVIVESVVGGSPLVDVVVFVLK